MNRIRIGAIGLGKVGSAQVETIARSVGAGDLVAVSDLDAARAQVIADALPGAV